MAGDHHLREPADDEEERREHDPPEAELGQTDCVPEVEDVPGEPEDERAEQDHRGEGGDRHGQSAGDEDADPENAQEDAENGAHAGHPTPRSKSASSKVGSDALPSRQSAR